MKQTPSLDHYALFMAIADAGGLAGAARLTKVSVPTLSRKMTELEAQLGQRLFERGARGYSLTLSGRSLLKETEGLREAASRLAAYASKEQRVHVRITAGEWTSQFLANHINQFWSPDEAWTPAFLASNSRVDIARREADIGIRNKRPDQNWLAGRMTNTIEFAVFAISVDINGYITFPEEAEATPSSQWLRQHHGDEVITTVNSIRLSVDLALAGVGRVILPTFAAQAFQGLQQIGPVIDALSHEEWLVCHHDARHDPPIRKALDAIYTLLSDRQLRGS